MYTFPKLIKQIRKESGLTQNEFAAALDVSPILISMIETGQREVSKGIIKKLAAKLDVPVSIVFPFVFSGEEKTIQNLSGLEKELIDIGSKLQLQLIKIKSKKLKRYAKS